MAQARDAALRAAQDRVHEVLGEDFYLDIHWEEQKGMNSHLVWGMALLALAGCSNPQPGASGLQDLHPSSPAFETTVEPGTWKLLVPSEAQHVTFKVNDTYLGGPGELRRADSYACTAAAGPLGWIGQASDLQTYHFVGSQLTAARIIGQNIWTQSQLADVRSFPKTSIGAEASSLTSLGGILLAHDREGAAVSSTRVVTSSATAAVAMEGKFYCLDGPSQFHSGTYVASNQALNASGLYWNFTSDNGLLIRLRIDGNPGIQAHVESLTGRFRVDDANVGSIDATFCSTTPGNWAVAVDHVVSTGGVSATLEPSWRITAEIFDIKVPDAACEEEWVLDWLRK